MKQGRLPILEFFKDTFSAMKMSGKRSVLSGAVTAWGVFIFVVIVGVGNGFNRGLKSNFDFFLEYGMISISPGTINTPTNGLTKGRQISLYEDDADFIKLMFANRAEGVYPRKITKSICSSTTGTAITPVCDFREGLDEKFLYYKAGNEMTEMDFLEGRRVCIIPQSVCAQLFDSPKKAIGQTIQIDGIPFMVSGVFDAVHNLNITNIFIPYKAAMSLHGMTNEISSIEVKIFKNMPATEKFLLKDDLKKALSSKKGFDYDDMYALHFEEQLEYINSQEQFVWSIQLFTTLLGILSLLMGIIGISSIINLSVKERTQEIAIRLSCGASEMSIFALILGEAVITMLTFGMVGIMLASGLLKIGTVLMEEINKTTEWVIVGDMTVSLSLVLTSVGLIVLCGVIAGFAPARKAVLTDISKAMTSL